MTALITVLVTILKILVWATAIMLVISLVVVAQRKDNE